MGAEEGLGLFLVLLDTEYKRPWTPTGKAWPQIHTLPPGPVQTPGAIISIPSQSPTQGGCGSFLQSGLRMKPECPNPAALQLGCAPHHLQGQLQLPQWAWTGT